VVNKQLRSWIEGMKGYPVGLLQKNKPLFEQGLYDLTQ
jgi:hypothetical protein